MSKSVIAFITGNAVIYLVFVFVTWEINPANWSEAGRALSAIFGVLVGFWLLQKQV
jgi:hypothetical protein